MIRGGMLSTIATISPMDALGRWRYVLLVLINPLFIKPYQDLKDRYYSVCRKLIRNRPWAGDEMSKALMIQSFQFDKGLTSSLKH